MEINKIDSTIIKSSNILRFAVEKKTVNNYPSTPNIFKIYKYNHKKKFRKLYIKSAQSLINASFFLTFISIKLNF